MDQNGNPLFLAVHRNSAYISNNKKINLLAQVESSILWKWVGPTAGNENQALTPILLGPSCP